MVVLEYTNNYDKISFDSGRDSDTSVDKCLCDIINYKKILRK